MPKKSANYSISIGLEDERGARNEAKSKITVEVEYNEKHEEVIELIG